MIEKAEEAQRKLTHSQNQCRICVSYTRSSAGMSFENLPLMSLILKKVTVDYPQVIYSLERITCDDQRVVFIILFSEDLNWVRIINGYESNIEVCREENFMINRVNSQHVLLDILCVCWIHAGMHCLDCLAFMSLVTMFISLSIFCVYF